MQTPLLQCSYIAYPHPEAPHAGNFLPLLLVSVFFALYVTALYMRKAQRAKWNPWRTAGFITGCLLAGLSLSPLLSDYAHHDFRGHMVQHLVLGMLVPIGLVMGAPVTLLLQALPKSGAKGLVRIFNNSFFHFLSHPVTALLLNAGGMFAVYLTPVYNQMHQYPMLQMAVHVHFLAAGYLFTWSLVGPDPAPKRPGLATRLIVLFLGIAAHGYLSKVLFAYQYPGNSLHSLAEIQTGAKIMYYGGDAIELLLVIVLFTIWYQKKGKPHYRIFARQISPETRGGDREW